MSGTAGWRFEHSASSSRHTAWLCGLVNVGDSVSRRLSHPVVSRTGFSAIVSWFEPRINGLDDIISRRICAFSRPTLRRSAVAHIILDQNGRHRHALWWGRHWYRGFAGWRPRTWAFLQQEDFPPADVLPPLHRHAVGSHRTRLSVRRLVDKAVTPFDRFVDHPFPGDH